MESTKCCLLLLAFLLSEVIPAGSIAETARIGEEKLKKLHFDENGLAGVYSEVTGWSYVNRKGETVISGVATMDNGPDYFSDGLVRFTKNNKWGFANSKGLVVVSPEFDGALPFENGIARVCNDCKSECADGICENHVLTGGTWLCIDKKGAKLDKCP